MSDSGRDHLAIVDAFAQLAVDIDVTESGREADLERLRSLTASALRAQLRDDPTYEALPPALSRLHQVVPTSARDALLAIVDALDAGDRAPEEALVVTRRDIRDSLISGRLVDSLSALSPGERLGPFPTLGGIEIWIDVFTPAQRMEIVETGASAPAVILSQARLPVIRRASTTIDVEPGTAWIWGDLVDGGLPAAAYAGIRVSGGSFRLAQKATVTGDVVTVTAPLKGTLVLELAPDEVTPVAGACAAAGAKVTLPETLTFTFDAGSSTAEGQPGVARVWGQEFTFGPSTGNWTFIERLWTVVLEYDVDPTRFDADPIGDDLVHFAGVGDVGGAGLGLPVVVATNPAILGEAAYAAAWFLLVKGLTARWYAPDLRLHELGAAWVGVSAFGATIVADAVAPLTQPVTYAWDLWTIAGGSDKRLPWRTTHDDPFMLFYRCHVVDGEQFLVQGRVDLALDRPVTTNGVPLPTATEGGSLYLLRLDGKITAMLGATVGEDEAFHQFALRNALVWTSSPPFIWVSGAVTAPQRIDAGTAHMMLGVYGWVPTLPDPYVSNAFIRRPRIRRGAPRAVIVGRVTWTSPTLVAVSFEGILGPDLALGEREVSSGESRPARKADDDPDVGPTQVEQDRLTFSRKDLGQWIEARNLEEETRGQRLELAQQENKQSFGIVDGYMAEVVGRTPGLLLLDVSTNQDLLGVAVGGRASDTSASGAGEFPVSGLAVHSEVNGMRVVTLPQVQWEPVRTLDADQDIMTMGWFPTPLASATDGGATQIGARYQKLMPVIPEDALKGTFDAYREGISVGIRTTFPFGLIAAIQVQPKDQGPRRADLYALTRPTFPDEQSEGGIQVTAQAEGGRPDAGGVSPAFEGRLRQLLNGVDLPSGLPLGISVLGETLQPAGSVESVFNNDMAARPRVPVTRIDLSGYGGSNFSDWNNPFAAFAEAAKVQFRYMIGRTALEVIKVNSVLHPWGVRVTRSVTIERRPGGGVIRRDSGWQAFTPGIFDYRYLDPAIGTDPADIQVAPYAFDAGVFRGLFNVRTIRPAPGTVFSDSGATLVPYYFDADVALEGVPGRTAGIGILGYLQVEPNGVPASASAIRALIETQGPIGGPIEAWMDFGGSGLPFRAQRIEVGLADDGGNPLFVATVRGVPKLPETGAWSVVTRPVASIPPGGGEAVPVAENRGVPVIRRYPVAYPAGDATVFSEPPLTGAPGDYRFADAADVLTPAAPAHDYALVQSTPTHAFLYPRPYVDAATAPRIESGHQAALADIFARSTSKGAFPPAGNTIELPAGSLYFDVTPGGKLALSAPVTITGHPTPLRIGGTTGHGSSLFYDTATLRLELEADRWEAEFTGLRIWSDISGLNEITGSEMRIVGSTDQRPQIAEMKTLMLQEIEDILTYIPIFGTRGTQGPIDLGATNAKHELKIDVKYGVTIPPTQAVFPAGAGIKLKLFVKQSTGVDLATGGAKASATFGAGLEGKIPVLSVGVVAVFIVVTGEISFSLTSVSGTVTSEKLELMAFVGIGVEGKIGPFKAYAFLGIGFVLVYDAIANVTKYGGLVALEAGVDLVIVNVKIRAELKGLFYFDPVAAVNKCDYSGSVKVQVDIFLVFSISATYQVTETATI
ncbi:MAG: hypothetical protein M3457_17580 [Chloroflexota bacterium]|nr:hypothetical protein [Chloroflexota bacterium]